MATPPSYTATTDRFYDRLPDLYRTSDAKQTPPWPLLTLVSAILDQAGEVEATIDDIIGDHDTPSLLADPQNQPASWLPWLAQTVGVSLPAALTEQQKRDAISTASSGWRAATRQAVADAAKSVLTGDRYARVYPHSMSLATEGQDPWYELLVVTRPTETPDPDLVLSTIITKGAKPAGVRLHHEMYAADWTTVEAQYTTWQDWHDEGSWRNIEDTLSQQ